MVGKASEAWIPMLVVYYFSGLFLYEVTSMVEMFTVKPNPIIIHLLCYAIFFLWESIERGKKADWFLYVYFTKFIK